MKSQELFKELMAAVNSKKPLKETQLLQNQYEAALKEEMRPVILADERSKIENEKTVRDTFLKTMAFNWTDQLNDIPVEVFLHTDMSKDDRTLCHKGKVVSFPWLPKITKIDPLTKKEVTEDGKLYVSLSLRVSKNIPLKEGKKAKETEETDKETAVKETSK